MLSQHSPKKQCTSSSREQCLARATHSFFEAVARGTAAAHALAACEVDEVESSLHRLPCDAVAAGDEELEHAVGARRALVAARGGGGACVERAVQQAGDGVLAVNRDHGEVGDVNPLAAAFVLDVQRRFLVLASMRQINKQ